MIVLYNVSIEAVATCVSSCVTGVSVDVETKMKYEDVCIVECLPIQFVGGCNVHSLCPNVCGGRSYIVSMQLFGSAFPRCTALQQSVKNLL